MARTRATATKAASKSKAKRAAPARNKPPAKKAAKKPAKKATNSAAKKTAKSKPAAKNGAAATRISQGRANGKSATKSPKKLRAVSNRKEMSSAPLAPKKKNGSASSTTTAIRGAAPWVARHAAKRAEELRRRNAIPPPPGSARATLRTPAEAERIKTDIAQLYQLTSKVNGMRKRVETEFYEIGELLSDIQARQLYEAKGYSCFETFLDREVKLVRKLCLRLVRIVHTFIRETAYDYGLQKLTTALAALDGDLEGPSSHTSSRSFSQMGMPPRPPR